MKQIRVRMVVLGALSSILMGCAGHDFHPQNAQSLQQKLPAQIFFGFNKDRITQTDEALLDGQATLLKKYQESIILIEGNTDAIGSANYNMELGDRRAHRVMVELVQRGVDPKQLIVLSHGENHPLTPGLNENQRAKNRRVELVIRK